VTYSVFGGTLNLTQPTDHFGSMCQIKLGTFDLDTLSLGAKIGDSTQVCALSDAV